MTEDSKPEVPVKRYVVVFGPLMQFEALAKDKGHADEMARRQHGRVVPMTADEPWPHAGDGYAEY